MALSIKDPEVDRLVRRLAQRERTSMTGAIRMAVNNELKRGARFSPEECLRRIATIREIQQEIAKDRIDPTMTKDEILGYDAFGVPELPRVR